MIKPKSRPEWAASLLAHRVSHNLTQKQLSEAIKVKQSNLSEMETGKRPIGKRMAYRIADFFKTDYREFL